MNKSVIGINMLLLASMVLAASCVMQTPAPVSNANTLSAVKVPEATLDGAASFWSNAPKLEVQMKAAEEGKPDGPVMMLQAVYDANDLAIRCEWADPTGNITRQDWTWDGTRFTRATVTDDRLAIMWPIGDDPTFASSGCWGVCHNQGDDPETWYMGSPKANLQARFDYWMWLSARSNWANQANDCYMTGCYDQNGVETMHNDQQKAGGPAHNINEAKDGPAFMSGTDLRRKFLMKGDELPVDTSKLQPGDVVPGYIIAPYQESRGDVSAKGTWANGKWVLVMKRAPNTGHEDDAVFTPPKAVPLGIAVTDTNDHYHHTVSADVLTLEWK